jgi:hypothetical protein
MADKMKVQYFKATRDTHRFRKNQKVWIDVNHANHLTIRFRWRGSGRTVMGTIDKLHKSVGEIKEISVTSKDLECIGAYPSDCTG